MGLNEVIFVYYKIIVNVNTNGRDVCIIELNELKPNGIETVIL